MGDHERPIAAALDALIRGITKANRYAVEDPEAAPAFARKSAEAICIHLFTAHVGRPHRPTLDTMARQLLQRGLLPPRMLQPLLTIQQYGNFVIHAQPDEDPIDERYIVPCIAALMQLTEWFFLEYLSTDIPVSITASWPAGWNASWDAAARRAAAAPAAERPGPAIASLEDVISWNWDPSDVLQQMIDIDYLTMPNLNDRNEGRMDQWLPVILNHPDTWRLLVDRAARRVVGYWHFVPLFDGDYERALNGQFYDIEITADRLCFLAIPGRYRAYFVGIATLAPHRSVKSFRLLFDSFLEQLVMLAERGVFLEEMCTNAFSPEGVSLCETLRMERVRDHEEFGRIYILRLLPPPTAMRVVQANARLLELYAEVCGAP